MRLRCPICNKEIDSTALRMEWGPGGGYRCPSCQGLVRYCPPYLGLNAVVSLLIALAILITLGVRTIGTLLALSALIWYPVPLLVNVAASRIKPPTLKRRRDRGYAPAYQIFGEGSHAMPTAPEPATHGQEPSEANSDEGARKN